MTRFEFLEIVRCNPFNRIVLERLPALALPDCWLVSGALFQTVWNARTNRRPDHGIRDYDIFYFDPDVSWEAEDAAIKRAAALFADLGIAVELRNQARVHLWYEQKFGKPYPRLARATDGIDRFLMHNAQVGIRANRDETEVYAPRGFDDIFNMIVRPNRTPNFLPDRYMEKALRWKEHWPELTILPP
ncbi:MAG TPA: nucleotidyltransferase family protein [Nitrobacter sp.]|nr:nucleotidyltransferase family protein [Nitrobacter sp.]